MEIGHLRKLEKLLLQKNLLAELPNVREMYSQCCTLFVVVSFIPRAQTLGLCSSLTVLDVSCNQLEMFPSEVYMYM